MIFAERTYGPADARFFWPHPPAPPDNPIDTLRLFGRICCAMLADLLWRTTATIPERCKRSWVTRNIQHTVRDTGVSGWSVQGFLALAPGIDKNRASSLGARDRWHQTGLRGSALGSRARVLGYQFIPCLCFTGPERIIFVFKRRPLTTESGHRMAIRKHIHLTFPQSE